MCLCVRMFVCVCAGQSVKVGLAWSHDIIGLRRLLASQAAPPPSPLPLTSQTPSQSSWGVRVSPSSTFSAKTKARQESCGEFWKYFVFYRHISV